MIRDLPSPPSFHPLTTTVGELMRELGQPNVRSRHDGHSALTWHQDDCSIVVMDFGSHRTMATVQLPSMAAIEDAYDAACGGELYRRPEDQPAMILSELLALRAEIATLMTPAMKAPAPLRDRDYFSLAQAADWIGVGRTALFKLRNDRKYAKTEEAKARAFAPEYEINGRTKLRRDELDAWLASREGAVGRRKMP